MKNQVLIVGVVIVLVLAAVSISIQTNSFPFKLGCAPNCTLSSWRTSPTGQTGYCSNSVMGSTLICLRPAAVENNTVICNTTSYGCSSISNSAIQLQDAIFFSCPSTPTSGASGWFTEYSGQAEAQTYPCASTSTGIAVPSSLVEPTWKDLSGATFAKTWSLVGYALYNSGSWSGGQYTPPTVSGTVAIVLVVYYK